LILTVSPVLTDTTTVTICANQLPYNWNGVDYTAAGIYIDTLLTNASCDSISTLILTVSPVFSDTTAVTICNNQLPYSWNGNSYNVAGTYVDSMTTVAGCDSILTLILNVDTVTTSTTNANVCSTQLPYVWNGNSYTVAGTYTVTLQNAAGCDSVATLNLVVNEPTTSTTNVTICDNQLPYTWNGNTYNAEGTYSVTLQNAAGCDSVATLNLLANIPTISTTNTTICGNQLPFVWNGNNYTSAGTYLVMLQNAAGCDSLATLNLTVNTTSNSTTIDSTCANQPYVWNGNTYTTSGTYSATLTNAAGCDSIATLILLVKPIPALLITEPAAVCEPLTIDLTSPSITVGSDPGLSFTYWADSLATIPLTNPTAIGVSGIYYIKAQGVNNCTNTKPVPVTVLVYKLIAGIRYPTVTTAPNTNTQLSARNIGTSYLWSPPVGLNSTIIRTPVFNHDRETEYIINITRDNGCITVDTVLVKIFQPPTVIRSDIFVPKAWTPNRDGHNDKLFPLTVNIRELKYFRVFNRWGQLVFETNVIGYGWDGIFQGKPAIMDVYTWTVEAIGVDGKYYKKAGNSVLIR
jgi:gliding motility-associated-like protein